jgi:WD40 repeat protein
MSFAAWKPGAVKSAVLDVPVHVIEAAASPQLTATLKSHDDAVWQVAWAPDGGTLASLALGDGEAKLWDVAQRRVRATVRHDLGASYSMAFTGDGKTLAMGHFKRDAKAGLTGGISLWDTTTGQRTGLLEHAPSRGVLRIALAKDSRTLAAMESWQESKGIHKECVTLWDITTGKPSARIDDEPRAVAFSADGTVLARSSHVTKDNKIAGEIRRRDMVQGKDLAPMADFSTKSTLSSLTYSPDGRLLAGADYEGNVIIWDAQTGKVRTTMQVEEGRRVMSVAFSPDSAMLAAAVGDRLGRSHEPGLIVLWDAATGQRRGVLTGHTNAVLSVAFSPDGSLLASGSTDRTVRLWDVRSPAAASAR